MNKPKFPFKTAFFLFVCVILLSLAKDIPATNAFLKDMDSKQPLSAAGDLAVGLVDDTAVGNLTVSATHSRDVFVKNKGEAAMFVRVLFHPTLESATGQQRPLKKEELVASLTSEWVNGNDGYYYYKKKLPAKTTTSTPVFTKFVTTNGVKATEKLTFHFKVEAITSKGTTYRNAWWEGEQPSATSRASLVALDTALKAVAD